MDGPRYACLFPSHPRSVRQWCSCILSWPTWLGEVEDDLTTLLRPAVDEVLRAEATVVRIGAVYIAQVACDANRRLNLIRGGDYPTWDDTDQADRQIFITGVKTQLEHPDWSAERIHDYWMKDRLDNG